MKFNTSHTREIQTKLLCQIMQLCAILLFATLNCCNKENSKSTVSGDQEKLVSSKKITDEQVLKQAKLFLHLIDGKEACKMYNDTKRPPKVSFSSDAKVWNVSFNYAFGAMNIQLSSDATRANYLFLSGLVIKRSAEDNVEPHHPPLFTPDEMIELLNLPHNQFD